MKDLLTSSRILGLSLLSACWAGAGAQSLGSPVAEAWIGRPLTMSVPARFLTADSRDTCVDAEVFYGDRRVGEAQVRTSVTGVGQERRVHIRTEALIDEPIVTVSVRAGCASSITRNYTLLPELPSEALIAAWNRAAVAAPLAAVEAAPLGMATSTSPAVPRVRAPRPAAPQAVARAEDSKPVPRARNERIAPKEAATGPRLRLEPLEFEPQTLLRVTSSLSQPTGDPASRAAAALLWQAINADPQEVLRTSAMLQKLESDLARLRRDADRTRAEMAALRQRLDAAQPWYATPALVQLLALLALAALAAAAAFWWRARRAAALAEAWYLPPEPASEPVLVPVPADVGPRSNAAVRAAFVQEAPAAASAAGSVDLELPVAAPAVQSPRSPSGMLRVETLAATLEEVEFLASLGLAADAMDVLKAYLQDSAAPAPLAFFELMRQCELADDGAAVAAVRRRYARAFGAEPPPLQQVTAQLGLESLPELSARITRAWGQPQALQIIEDCLFEPPRPGATLTLQAGRDLVCLHHVALALASEAAGVPSAGSAADAHPLAPWADASDPAAAHAAAQAAAEAHGGAHFALDIDLGAAPAPLPEPQAPPEPEDVQLAPLLAQMQAAAAREAEARARQEQDDAFSAAVASERIPVSRY